MKKQFEIIEKIYEAIQDSEIKISALKKAIEEEYYAARQKLINAYNHEEAVLYLVQFETYGLVFHKATKKRVSSIHLTWFDNPTSKIVYRTAKTFKDGQRILNNICDPCPPTNVEIMSYNTFGYFDDIEKHYERIDWITENIMDKKFLYEITSEDFNKAVKVVADFYTS